MFAIANSETNETVLKILNLHEKMKIANIWKKNLFVGCRKTAEHWKDSYGKYFMQRQ